MPLADTRNPEGSSGWKALGPLLDPFLEYGRAMRVGTRSDQLGARIVANEIGVTALWKFLLAAAVLGALISKLIPDQDGFWGVDVPLLDEVIGVLMISIGGVLSSIIMFPFLRWAGGRGSFRHTMIAGVYVSGVLFPLIALAYGLSWQVAHWPHAPTALYYSFGLYFMGVLAAIHEIPPRRAVFIYLGVSLAVGIIAIGLLLLL
jgi:hypothetical protein